MSDQLNRMESRLDSIDGKLDNYLERMAFLEAGQKAHMGYIRVIITVILGAAAALFAKLIG